MPDYWGDKIRGKFSARLEASSEAIAARLGPPTQRKPDTKLLLSDAIADPSLYSDPESREMLEDRLFKTYGEAARFILPYVAEDQLPDGGIPDDPSLDEGFADGDGNTPPLQEQDILQ